MAKVSANGIRLEYELSGPEDGLPLLLIHGVGAQLEHFPTNLGRRDGAEFGPARGARRELCEHIVTDEQRCDGPNSARRFAVASGSPSDCVALLDRATSPTCTTLLAEKLPDAITVIQIGRKVL